MAWDVVSQTLNTVLPASKINQLADNFAALAAQNSGAPVVVFPNSVLNANAGMASTGVGSFGRVNADSGMASTGVGSFGAVNANSGFRTTQPGCFGVLNAADSAPAAPVAGTFYKDTAIRAWLVASANGTIASQMGIASVANPATGKYVVTLATSLSTARSWAAFGTGWNANEEMIVSTDPRSQSGGATVVLTYAAGASAALFSAGFTLCAVGS